MSHIQAQAQAPPQIIEGASLPCPNILSEGHSSSITTSDHHHLDPNSSNHGLSLSDKAIVSVTAIQGNATSDSSTIVTQKSDQLPASASPSGVSHNNQADQSDQSDDDDCHTDSCNKSAVRYSPTNLLVSDTMVIHYNFAFNSPIILNPCYNVMHTCMYRIE